MKFQKIYLIGSLRNPEIPNIANQLRELNIDVFDDWFAAGPRADDHWQEYEIGRGHDYIQALDGHAARHVYEFDRGHLDRSDGGVLALPAGRSGHLELGYLAGQGKRTYIVLGDNYDRFDVMYCFATKVVKNVEELIEELKKDEATTDRPANGNSILGATTYPDNFYSDIIEINSFDDGYDYGCGGGCDELYGN